MALLRRFAHPSNDLASKHDVFLLGAGFSHSVDEVMPLTNELTSGVKAELSDIFASEGLKRVPFLDSNFEKALSYLAEPQPWLPEAERLRNRALFLEVSRAIHEVLIDAQNKMLRRLPECPPWLSRLGSWMHLNRALVITLNYDTILEMALSELSFGGGNEFLSDDLRSFGVPAIEGRASIGSRSTLQLFKLHGSLHWTYSGMESYFGESIQDSTLPRWSIAVGDRHPFSPEDGRVPLIVPPTFNKNRHFENEKIRWTWQRASLALKYAQRVFCIGYSLPEADLLMRFLLHDSPPVGEARDVPFFLVNTDPNSVDHYRAALPSWFQLEEKHVCKGDPTVVQCFADALVAGDLDRPECTSTIGPVEAEIYALVRENCADGEIVTNWVDGSTFKVKYIDKYGVLLPDATRGSRYVQWSAFRGLLTKVNEGKLDCPPGIKIENKIAFPCDQLVFSLLKKVAAIAEERTDNAVVFTCRGLQ